MPEFGEFSDLVPANNFGEFSDLVPTTDFGEFTDLVPSEQGLAQTILREGPLQVLGGARDALQRVGETTGAFGAMEQFGEAMAPRKERLFRSQGIEPPERPPVGFPEVPQAETGIGAAVRGVSQFATAFIPILAASKATGLAGGIAAGAKALGAGTRAAKIAGTVGAIESSAVAADLAAFGPFEERLSNIVESFPALQNPITEYLAADKDDSEAEAIFKQALEGLSLSGAVGLPIAGIFRGVRKYKFNQDLGEALNDITFDADQSAREALSPGEVPPTEVPTQEIVPSDAPLASLDQPPLLETPPVEALSPQDVLEGEVSEFAGNIRLENIENTEDIARALTAVAETKGGFEEARRGIITQEQTKALAETLGLTEEALLARRAGQAFNAEEALAARDLLAQSSNELVALAQVARQGSAADLVDFKLAVTKHAAIQEQVSGVTAEAGRALQAFKIVAKSERARSLALDDIIRGAGGRDTIEHLADAIGELSDPDAVARYVRESAEATTSDKLLEAWVNSLLSGPQTHAVNMMSNTITGLWTIPEHFLAAGIGRVTKSGDQVAFREIPARLAGIMEGAKEGLGLAARTFVTEEPSHGTGKIEARRFQSIGSKKFREGKEGKKLFGVRVPLTGELELGGKQIRTPGRLLMASDEFFKSIGRRMELNGLAVRNARAEGLKGEELARRIVELKRNPTEEMTQQARDFAETVTFTKPLGPAGKAIQKIVQEHPAARLIAPFIRTPVNIVKFAGARTPFAFLSRNIRADIKAGGAKRDLTLARISMGTIVGAGTAALAGEGIITGGGPSDPTLRTNQRNAGWQPYSVKIGDEYFSYSRLEPLGILLGISADFAEIAGEISTVEADKIAAMITMSISKNLLSKTYMSGLTELNKAINDPDRYGERYIQRQAGTAVPTGVAQIARVSDPTMREVRSIIDGLKARIPGQSEDLPPRRNVWGEPILLGGGLGPDIISPIYTSQPKNDPVLDEVVRLKIPLRLPPKKIEGVELSAEEYSDFVREAGVPAKNLLDVIIASPSYQQSPDFARQELIEEVVRRWRSAARDNLIAKDPRFTQAKIKRVTPPPEQLGAPLGN